jgi:acylphosphatase
MRRRFVFSGRVQGVGFRASAREIARAFPITGWVRNDPDQRVTLEAQGPPEQLDRFIEALSRRMGPNIADTQATDLPPVSDEQGFRIAH